MNDNWTNLQENSKEDSREINEEVIDPAKKKRIYIDVDIVHNLSNLLEVKTLEHFLILEELYQPELFLRWENLSTSVGFIHGNYLFFHELRGSFPDLETYIHAKRLGISDYREYQKLMQDKAKAMEMGFESVDEYYQFLKSGFSTREEWLKARKLGFTDHDTYMMAKEDGFDNFDEWEEFRRSPYLNARDYREAKELKCKDLVTLYLYRILSKIEPRRSVAITKIQEMFVKSLKEMEVAPSKEDDFYFGDSIIDLDEIFEGDVKQIIMEKLKNEPIFKELGEYDDFGEVFLRW